MEPNKKEISLRGIVVPVDWDRDGNATRFALMSDDEEEYLLEENTRRGELLSLMRSHVEVRGLAREEAGRKIIVVERCAQTKRPRDKKGKKKERSS